MIRTRVGYAGGEKPNPTYNNLCGHSETLQIDFDPNQIVYEDLFAIFWKNHNPTSRPWSTQYKAIVFYHDENQKKVIDEWIAREHQRTGKKIYTEVEPFTSFTWAEDYHQKYRLRQRPEFMREFTTMYPDPHDFANSTAVARVNAYLGGHGTRATLDGEIDLYGLSEQAKNKLRKLVH